MKIARLSAAVFVAVLAACSLSAQEVSGGITGRVIDATGGSIANAKATAHDLDRGTNWETKTNQDGIYVYPRLPVGRYEVRFEAPGFKTAVRSGIVLELNQNPRVDVQMEVGAVLENVQVTAEAPLLETENTSVGTTMESEKIVNTPLLSRNFISLTLLAPGVTSPNPATLVNGVRSSSGGRPYVNGNREEANNILLDGVDNNQVSENHTSYQPNIDAIAEMRLITNNAPAEFGNFQGGIISVNIKSGTNEYHGDIFEFLRNDLLNANNWGNNWHTNPIIPRAPLRYNQFGGVAGGRIMRDRLFFFADYQGTRIAHPATPSPITVLPSAFRQGDFSALLTQATPIQLYNPYQADASGNRAPFLNNMIPKSLLSPAAYKLVNDPSLYPAPLNGNLRNNQINANPNYLQSDQGDFKLDYRITDKDYFTGRFSNGRQDQPGVNTFPLLYNTYNAAPFENGMINWNRTISPTMVNEFRFGINYIIENTGGADKGLGDIAAKVGIANTPPGLLSLTFTDGIASSLGNANIGAQNLFATTTFHYADNLTIVKGRHTMKMGGQVLRQWLNVFYAGNNGRTGYINFSGQFTGPSAANPGKNQYSEADFMLGLPSDLGKGLSTGTWGQRGVIYGVYFQDDWRAMDTLTLNLGLRWEYHTPWVEVKDRQSNFGLISGQLELAGQNGNSRALYNAYKKDFQPRIGFAWTPDFLGKKTVLRGAYTISSFLEGTGTNLRLPLNPPFNSEFQALYNRPTDLLPATTLDQGLSGLNPKNPYIGATIRLWNPNIRPAETQQWNFTVERQLPADTVISAAYVGQHGTHLIAATPYLQKQLLPNGTILPSPYLSGNPTLVSQIAQVSGTSTESSQKYNALQVSVRKRYSAGLEFQLSYTWSHGMSDSIGYYSDMGQAGPQSAYWQNLYDRHSEWAPTYFDTKHMFAGSYTYDIPFGKGRHFGSNWNRPVDTLLGGWQMGGILSLHTGFPLTIKYPIDPSATGARSFRANVVGTPNDSHAVGPGNHWLDKSAYAAPPPLTFGNAGPGVERGTGLVRFDLSLGKKFLVTEKTWFELRGEAYNLTNTPLFNSPLSQTITSAIFGEISSTQGERNLQVALKFYF